MIRDEEEQARLRLQQNAAKADKLGIPVPGRIIRAEERAFAESCASRLGLRVAFWGGFEEAERVQPCFYLDGEEPEFSGCWVEAAWNAKFGSAKHGDLLGSLMGLGFERCFLGDILVQDHSAYLWALPEMACRLPQEWTQAGRTSIRVRLLDTPPEIEPPKGIEFSDTVPSLRLDCILASVMKLSRTKASELINEGVVMVDHRPELRTDRILSENQIVSIRHFGRIRLARVGDLTRKGRLSVTLEIFQNK